MANKMWYNESILLWILKLVLNASVVQNEHLNGLTKNVVRQKKKIKKTMCEKAKVPGGRRVFSFEMKYILLYRLMDF